MDCYVLKAKSKHPTVQGKGAYVAVSMPTVSVVNGRSGKAQGDVLLNRLGYSSF